MSYMTANPLNLNSFQMCNKQCIVQVKQCIVQVKQCIVQVKQCIVQVKQCIVQGKTCLQLILPADV